MKHNYIIQISRPTERGLAQAGSEHGALPEAPFFHAGVRSPDDARQPGLPNLHRGGTHVPNVPQR